MSYVNLNPVERKILIEGIKLVKRKFALTLVLDNTLNLIGEAYYPSIAKLSNKIGNYDVKWKE